MKENKKSNKTIKITQIKSSIGRNKIQRKHLVALGLNKIGASKQIIFNKSTEGLINKISHLVEIEKVK